MMKSRIRPPVGGFCRWVGRRTICPIALALSVFHTAALLSAREDAGEKDAALLRDLVGHWQFNGSDGRIAKDFSPRRNDGTIEFAELRQEKGGTSLELDGIGGHVLIRELAPFEVSSAITTAIWFKAHELRNSTVLFGIPHTTESWTTPVFGMYAADGRVVYGMWLDRGRTKVLVESPAEVPLDTWTFVAATYDGARVRLYVNGTLGAEAPAAGNLAFNGQPLVIGKGLGTSKPSFRGRVGELRLYARALAAEEIRSLFERTCGTYDLSGPAPSRFQDGTVVVETHGNSPESERPWRPRPTRLLELLDGYRPAEEAAPLDRYGGWTDLPREAATGFFRVEKLDGRHWLIDPEGCRFYHIAMNATREPPRAADSFGSTDQWAETVTGQLRANGFNGLGNWSSPRLRSVTAPLVWVLRKDFMFAFAREKKLTEPAAGTQGFTNRCMPVFHPEFEAFCDRFGADLADTAGDPLLLGIMTDNELQCPGDLLDRYLALDASDPDLGPNRAAAAAWLSGRRGSPEIAEITQHDRYEFIAFAFERYYRIVTKAIRKYDANHLYLGSRINYRAGQFDNPWFFKSLAPYHDVVSVNYYNAWGLDARQLEKWEAWAGRPILITEWYAKALDVPGLANRLGAGWLVRTQEDRGRYYQHFALSALENRSVVGWHWFKYLDDPAESQALDSAGGANKGMFDLQGRPYQPLLDRARAVNQQAKPLIQFFDARSRPE